MLTLLTFGLALATLLNGNSSALVIDTCPASTHAYTHTHTHTHADTHTHMHMDTYTHM